MKRDMKMKKILKVVIPATLIVLMGILVTWANTNKVIEAKEDTISTSSMEETVAENTDVATGLNIEQAVDSLKEAETKETDKTAEELKNAEYSSEASLKEAYFIGNEQLEETTTENNTEESSNKNLEKISPVAETSKIYIPKIDVTIKTGSGTMDSNDNPGYDSSLTNNKVRSFDQISYLVSFSVQTVDLTEKYTDIKYKVTATMPNAVSLVSGTPRNNGEIANGTYSGGTGAQSSTGSIESSIAYNGQVFLPIVLNVYGASNGTSITPTFQVEIVSAKNVSTGNTESINKIYTTDDTDALKVSPTIVSALPSISVRLKAGQVTDRYSTVLPSDPYAKAYDVGVTQQLKEISGRVSGDLKGSTFPSGDVTYTIKQSVTYNGTTNSVPTYMNPNPVRLRAIGDAQINKNTSVWAKIGTVNPLGFTSILDIPRGITNQLYMTQPTSNFENIGVYNGGTSRGSTNDSTRLTTITTKNYVPVNNPYTYTLQKNAVASTDKMYTSDEFIFEWNDYNLSNYASMYGYNRYDMSLYVDSVTYNGTTTVNDTSITFPTIITADGAFAGGPLFSKSTTGNDENFINLDLNHTSMAVNTGDGRLNQGEEMYFSSFNLTTHMKVQTDKSILMWDPTAFQYDNTRLSIISTGQDMSNVASRTFRYGVAKNINLTSPYTMNIEGFYTTQSRYNWYSTVAAAQAVGSISAVESTMILNSPSGSEHTFYPRIPVKVIGNAGSLTPAGNPITIMESTFWGDIDGNEVYVPLPSAADSIYRPTQYNSAGNAITPIPYGYWNWFGDTGYIEPFRITTTTKVEKKLYKSSEDINIKVRGILSGNKDVSYDTRLTTTLPKGINYKAGSSKDALGVATTDPTVSTDSSTGITTLVWNFTNQKGQAALTAGDEINFIATSDVSQLTFGTEGYTDNLVVKTVGEMWVTGNTTDKDSSAEALRSSNDYFVESIDQKVTIEKTHNRVAIEVGDTDTVLNPDNTITYTLTMTNQSALPLTNARILDVLPYNGDVRGSIISGGYEVVQANLSGHQGTANLNYSTRTDLTTDADPNVEVTNGFTDFSNSSSPSIYKNATAIGAYIANMPVGNKVVLTITIKPTDQQPGDKYVNTTMINSALNLPVQSQSVTSQVYGRTLSGTAWYDLNRDGLIDDSEAKFPNVPVKLYRTVKNSSGTEIKQYLTQDLKGNTLIDSSGNSTVQTDSSGYYIFKNLPRGDYNVEFGIQDEIDANKLVVTIQEAGGTANNAINSKTIQPTPKTGVYTEPTISDMISQTLTNNTFNLPYINMGVYEPGEGTVDIFKYIDGTAKDDDDDGELSDEEKSKGTALAGAEFEVYRESDDVKVASGVTGADGHLLFTLPYDKYYLIETKAPDGYELIKTKIPFEITDENATVKLYLENRKQTILPFTGGKNLVILLMIVSLLSISGGLVFYLVKWVKIFQEGTDE